MLIDLRLGSYTDLLVVCVAAAPRPSTVWASALRSFTRPVPQPTPAKPASFGPLADPADRIVRSGRLPVRQQQ